MGAVVGSWGTLSPCLPSSPPVYRVCLSPRPSCPFQLSSSLPRSMTLQFFVVDPLLSPRLSMRDRTGRGAPVLRGPSLSGRPRAHLPYRQEGVSPPLRSPAPGGLPSSPVRRVAGNGQRSSGRHPTQEPCMCWCVSVQRAIDRTLRSQSTLPLPARPLSQKAWRRCHRWTLAVVAVPAVSVP